MSGGLACALGLSPAWCRAQSLPTPIDHLGDDVVASFSGPRLLYHAGAVAVTATFVLGGVDHAVRVGVQRGVEGSTTASALSRGTVIGGYALPALVPLLYVSARLAGHEPTTRAGAAATQAVVLTVATTFALKALTGRPFPLRGRDPRAPDRLDHPGDARAFSPPSLTEVAWPSGHTSAAFALASSLTWSMPGRWWVPAVSYPVATLIGAGMIVGDHHWASDVLAGALLGQAIGSAVGSGFRPAAEASSFVLVPLPQRGALGAALAGQFLSSSGRGDAERAERTPSAPVMQTPSNEPLSASQRARIRRLSTPQEHDPSEAGGELNVVPFLDIVMNVLLFVLATMPAVFTASVLVDPPARMGPRDRPRMPLSLTMLLTEEGVGLKTASGSVGEGCQAGGGLVVRARDGAVDWSEVKACARKLKASEPSFASEVDVTLVASNGIPYASVVAAMDAVREDGEGALFPEVTFGVPR